jgi:methionyl-tRNA synthetase
VGNGLSRVLKLAGGLDHRLASAEAGDEESKALRKAAEDTVASSLEKVKALKLSHALEDVLQLVRAVNRYLEAKAPWKLAKLGEEGKPALNAVLYHAAEALRIAFSLLHPVMPTKMEEALGALGLTPATSSLRWGVLGPDQALAAGLNLFPRIEVKPPPGQAPKARAAEGKAPADPFALVHLKVAQVEGVEDHPNADALYVLRLKVGEEARTVCAGLRKHLAKEELQGRKVVMVYNLKPANLRGVESMGMILAAEGEGGKLAPVDPGAALPGEDVTAEGIVPAPKSGLTLKDFEKAPLQARAGKVVYGEKPLITSRGPVTAAAPDGTSVR